MGGGERGIKSKYAPVQWRLETIPEVDFLNSGKSLLNLDVEALLAIYIFIDNIKCKSLFKKRRQG